MPATMMLERMAAYPVEDRVMMADALIESLNGADPAVEAAWGALASRRLRELRTGKVRGVSAATVFARARRARFVVHGAWRNLSGDEPCHHAFSKMIFECS